MMIFALMLGAIMLLMTIVGNKIGEYREEIAVREQWIAALEQTVAFKSQTINQLDVIINRLEQEIEDLKDGIPSRV